MDDPVFTLHAHDEAISGKDMKMAITQKNCRFLVLNVYIKALKCSEPSKFCCGLVLGIALSTQLPGCLISVSQDKIVKVWDIEVHRKYFSSFHGYRNTSFYNLF